MKVKKNEQFSKLFKILSVCLMYSVFCNWTLKQMIVAHWSNDIECLKITNFILRCHSISTSTFSKTVEIILNSSFISPIMFHEQMFNGKQLTIMANFFKLCGKKQQNIFSVNEPLPFNVNEGCKSFWKYKFIWYKLF